MKKLIICVLLLSAMLTGCQTVSDMITVEPTPMGATAPPATDSPQDGAPDSRLQQIDKNFKGDSDTEPSADKNPLPEGVEARIEPSGIVKMNSQWLMLGDFRYNFTAPNANNRVLLACSAEVLRNKIQWENSQVWSLSVIGDHGAYNLYSKQINGRAYMEVADYYIDGIKTPVVVLYVFTAKNRQILMYWYKAEEDCFYMKTLYNGIDVSTSGMQSQYSTIPEYTFDERINKNNGL